MDGKENEPIDTDEPALKKKAEESDTKKDTPTEKQAGEDITNTQSPPGGDQAQPTPQSPSHSVTTPTLSTLQPTDTQSIPDEATASSSKEHVQFKIVYNKEKYEIDFALDDKISELKQHLEKRTGVPASMQKIMFKGLMKDDNTLRQQKISKNSKVMLVGSKLNDVMAVNVVSEEEKKKILQEDKPVKEPLSKSKPHKTVLEKHGKPDDVMIGVKNKKEPLPPAPLSGMYNKTGGKVRLTFKLESDQLWIGTKERTEKVSMNSIKAVVSEAMEGSEDYHIMGIQLGPTEASRYWIYWVPAQYIDAIKDAVLGKWQF